jgi:hypothetical protein
MSGLSARIIAACMVSTRARKDVGRNFMMIEGRDNGVDGNEEHWSKKIKL